MDISVVVPVYGCREAIPELYSRLCKTLEQIVDTFEIILVDDCCPYGSWEEIKKICEIDKRVMGLHMSRNFGQIKAITAGLDNCSGDWVVVMDCDLQDRPEGIIDLYNKAKEGYDVVFARRLDRVDKGITKFLSHAFYKVYDYFTDGKFDNSICNFSISKRKVIQSYCKMREQKRAYTLFLRWLGYNQTAIDVKADARFAGESSYNFKRKINMAFDFITSQSVKPLHFAIKIGFTISFISLIYIIYLIVRYFQGGVNTGWTSTIASIYLMGGLILAAVGVVGIYVGNIFEESKGRPLYVISEYMNKEN